MCGIVGAVAQRPVSGILLEGLRRLEYRGYDSAGLAVLDGQQIHRLRRAGKVENLSQAEKETPLGGFNGIAHTRWATHGKPTENNAHPHMSGDDLAIVHNGIIENFEPLKRELQAQGYQFTSDTDTEVIPNLIADQFDHQSLTYSNPKPFESNLLEILLLLKKTLLQVKNKNRLHLLSYLLMYQIQHHLY